MSVTNPNLIPNSFQVPNVFVDKIFLILESSDVKILLFVCRKTYGWQKTKDRISLSQFEKGTGLSRRCLVYRLKLLTDSGLLCREQTKMGDIYWLNLAADLDIATAILVKSKDEVGGATDAPVQPLHQVQRMHHPSATDAPVGGATDAPTETHVFKPTKINPKTLSAASQPEDKKHTLHYACKKEFETYWNSMNDSDIPMTWDGSEARAMTSFLAANPKISAVGFARLLAHRAASEVNHSERPRSVLPKLINFARGPLDTYNKPKSKGGNKSDEQNKRIDNGNAVLSGWAADAVARAENIAGGELSARGRPLLGKTG